MKITEKQVPLRVTITATGQENLVLRALLRQAVPMLLRPEAYPPKQRCQLAQDVTLLLDGTLPQEDDLSAGEGTETDAETGCQEEREGRW